MIIVPRAIDRNKTIELGCYAGPDACLFESTWPLYQRQAVHSGRSPCPSCRGAVKETINNESYTATWMVFVEFGHSSLSGNPVHATLWPCAVSMPRPNNTTLTHLRSSFGISPDFKTRTQQQRTPFHFTSRFDPLSSVGSLNFATMSVTCQFRISQLSDTQVEHVLYISGCLVVSNDLYSLH